MALTTIQLNNKSNPSRFQQGGSATLINAYAEPIGKEGKVSWCLVGREGMQGFCLLDGITEGVGLGCRAGLEVDGYAYIVAGISLYKVDVYGNPTLIGNMSISTTAPVFMARNRRAIADIAIVCDGIMYVVRAGVLTLATDPDLLGPLTIDYSDGYFAMTTSLNQWQLTSIDDGLNVSALDIATADAHPDALKRVMGLQAQFLLFGAETIEFWTDTGTGDFPYSRSSAINVGLWATNSPARMSDAIAFIANDRTVRLLSGYNPKNISEETRQVERDISSVDADTIIGTSYVSGGHWFYKITCPSWTWVYDVSTGFWAEFKTEGQDNWRVSFVLELGTKLIAGDADTGAVFELSRDFLDDAGTEMVSGVTLPTVHAFPHRVTHWGVFLDVERGVGTGQGEPQDIAPEIMLAWSDDGGANFGYERNIEIGEQGQRRTWVDSFRLGQAPRDGRVYRLRISARVARAVYQIKADLTVDSGQVGT